MTKASSTWMVGGLNRCSDNFNFCPSCKNSHRSVNQNGFHENNASFQKNIVQCSRACRCVVWCVWTLRKRFRKKYVYPRPQIPWYGDLLGKEQISKLWGNNTIQFDAKEQCAVASTNVIVCFVVRDPRYYSCFSNFLLFAIPICLLHYSAISLLIWEVFYHFLFCICSRPGENWNGEKECFILQICSTFDLLCSNLGCF